MLLTEGVQKDLFAFGRVLAIAWYNGTTVVALDGTLHESIYHFLTNDETTFLQENAQHYSYEHWKPLELVPNQFKSMYQNFREVTKKSLVDVFEFF